MFKRLNVKRSVFIHDMYKNFAKLGKHADLISHFEKRNRLSSFYIKSLLKKEKSQFKVGKDPIQVVIKENIPLKIASFFAKAGLFVIVASFLLSQQSDSKMMGMFGLEEVVPTIMKESVTFDDVQGCDEAKEELEEVVQFLKNPDRYLTLGGKLPKGILLYGPPGTGKTFLAKAVAGEAGVNFFQASGSEFEEMFVGLGAKRIRNLFKAAKLAAPCIVFIDELDSIGGKRGHTEGNAARQTMNQLLVELDGFSFSDGVIVIGATNTPEILDKALIRPGRFDRMVPVQLPDLRGRANILKVHLKNVKIDSSVQPEILARGTPGFSGADLKNLINNAAIKASKDNCDFVTMKHLEWSKDRILMGAERKSALITPKNKLITAYHEGGHALMSIYSENADPLHKVTIIPRGMALGVTVSLPEADRVSISKKELFARLDVCMGGRVAEELVFGKDSVTTGAHNDLENATEIAKNMVRTYGMNERFGLSVFGEKSWETVSSETKAIAELETNKILEDAYNRTKKALGAHRVELDRLANGLLEYETLTADEVKNIIKGEHLVV